MFAPGDLDLDGIADLVARNAKGELYLYKGTGKAAARYKPKAINRTPGHRGCGPPVRGPRGTSGATALTPWPDG